MRRFRTVLSVLIVGVAVAAAGWLLPGAFAAQQRESPGIQDADDPARVSDCVIAANRIIDVPAQEAGQLIEMKVRESQQVKKGEILAQIDDRQAVAARKVAESKVVAAEKEAGNLISVKYAQGKNWVAKAAYDMGEGANKKVPGTTPELELIKLKLEVYASGLEIEHSEYQLQIAAINVDVRKAELDAARLDEAFRKIVAPWDGEVVRRMREEGEWVKPGDPVVRLVEMDRLVIEPFLDAAKLAPAEVDQRPVSVQVELPHGEKVPFEGKVASVSPEVETGGRFSVRIEIANQRDPKSGYWLLRPGMIAQIQIHVK